MGERKRSTLAQLGVVWLLAASPADAEVLVTGDDGPIRCPYCAPFEFDKLAILLGDDALRDMVCRLAFQSHGVGRLSAALGLPSDEVMGRIDTLRRWGLVRTRSPDSRGMIVEPLPGDGANTLRRWASRYCPLGDGCREPVRDDELAVDDGLPLSLGDGIPFPATNDRERNLRFLQTMIRIDAINLGDPTKISRDGEPWAREVYISRRRSYWLHQLSPGASDLVRIAARAQHIARWEIPRASYPKGRLGYHQYRAALAKLHVDKMTAILVEMGYQSHEIARVNELIEKKNFKLDKEAQLIEDVASIVFFEFEFDDFATTQPDDKLVNIVRKSWHKMSPEGHKVVRKLDLSRKAREVIRAALLSDREVKY